MEFVVFQAGADDDGRRIDKVLRRFLKDLPLSEIYKSIRKGLLKVNGKKISADFKISQNDKISVPKFFIPENKNNAIQTEQNKTHINLEKITVLKNEHFLILNKPYDLKTHGKNSLDEIVKNFYEKKIKNKSLSFTTGPLHRLDRMTSGLVVFSMSLAGAKWFSENIKNHTIQKFYIGIVEGTITEKQTWNTAIEKTDDSNSKNFHTVRAKKIDLANKTHSEKNALTIASPVKNINLCGKNATLMEFKIETGRQHQIRAQCSYFGHPLFGDSAYGSKELENSPRQFFLHAAKIIFPENNLGLPNFLELPYPEDFPI